jgi:hypothetical protein
MAHSDSAVDSIRAGATGSCLSCCLALIALIANPSLTLVADYIEIDSIAVDGSEQSRDGRGGVWLVLVKHWPS